MRALSLWVRNVLFQGLCPKMKMRSRRYRSTYSQNVLEQIVVNCVVVAAVVLVCKWSKVSKPLIKLVCNTLVFWHEKYFVSDILPVYSSCTVVLLNYTNFLLQQGFLSFHHRVWHWLLPQTHTALCGPRFHLQWHFQHFSTEITPLGAGCYLWRYFGIRHATGSPHHALSLMLSTANPHFWLRPNYVFFLL